MFASAVFALSFLLNLRLRQINLPTYIESTYGTDGLRLFWNYGNTLKKLNKANLDIDFLSKCKVYNVFPRFLRFKLYKTALHATSFYKKWQTKLLLHELKCRKTTSERLSHQLSSIEQEMNTTFTSFNCRLTERFFRRKTDKEATRTGEIHRRKLADLGVNNDLNPCNPDLTVFNFSNISVSHRLKTLLAFGLDFCLPTRNLDFVSYFSKFEILYNNLSNHQNECNNFPEFKSKLRSTVMKYFYSFKSYKVFSCIFSQSDIKELKALGKNKDIVVTKPDKGRGVVILDRSIYLQKLNELISDRTKFTEITDNIHTYSTRVEDKINNFLRKMKNLKLLSDITYKKLFVSGSGPGILYGLPKIHKSNFNVNFPFRPIFAAYNAASYKIAKFLVPILAPLTTNDFTIDNSHSFVQSLKTIKGSENLYMSSFDVTNLFTNIPLDETINICLDSFFTSDNSTVIGLTKQYFKQFLELSVKNLFFMFDSKLYKQTDGLGMGLPLGPTFANIFMCFHERRWLGECPEAFRPIFYKRYVDDTFLLFKNRNHVPLFLDYLNSQHSNIKFTSQVEENKIISFLDIEIQRFNDNFATSVYRKPTFSGQGLSFFSFCSFLFKINAMKTLIHRAYRLSSSYFKLNDEFEFLVNYFRNNGYPSPLIYSQIKQFMNKLFLVNINDFENDSRQPFYCSLPFFGPQTDRLKNELDSMFTKYFPTIKFKPIFVNNYTVSSFFRFKDSLPIMSRSSVVYLFLCPHCGDRYVGSTSRTLFVRTSEHEGRSHRTGALLACPPHSAVRDHSEHTCHSRVNKNDFSIIASASNPVSLRIIESLIIHKTKPQLNDYNSAFPLNIVK